MNKKTSKRLTVALMISLFTLYLITKFYLRSLTIQHSFLGIVIGSIPNFIAATAIPLALFLELYKAKFLAELNKSDKRITILMIVIIVILILEEFFPLFSGSKVFDLWDISFSLIGIGLSFIYKSKIVTIIKYESHLE